MFAILAHATQKLGTFFWLVLKGFSRPVQPMKQGEAKKV